MEHTKGSWKVDFFNNDQTMAEITIGKKGDLGFTSFPYFATDEENFILSPTDKATVCLIAAAPDLIEACEYVVNWHKEHDSGEGELYGQDFVTNCINAIQKAKEG